jgi:protein involved in polysaccharide export with SLBB domain
MTYFQAVLCAAALLFAGPACGQSASGVQGIADKPATAPSTAAREGQAQAAAVSSADQNYRFGIADKVRVIVFNEETLSGEFTVSDAGTLSLPLIGDVQASGRTPREVVKDIEAKLADGYLREPRVSMDVLTYRPFYILGEVSKPGEYAYSNGLTAINAIARAEGFTYRANKKKVWIRRAGQSEEESYKLGSDVRVYPGDTVRIGERFF